MMNIKVEVLFIPWLKPGAIDTDTDAAGLSIAPGFSQGKTNNPIKGMNDTIIAAISDNLQYISDNLGVSFP